MAKNTAARMTQTETPLQKKILKIRFVLFIMILSYVVEAFSPRTEVVLETLPVKKSN